MRIQVLKELTDKLTEVNALLGHLNVDPDAGNFSGLDLVRLQSQLSHVRHVVDHMMLIVTASQKDISFQ